MIYLDSAATTFQKPLSVSYAMQRAMRTMSSPGRGGYAAARAAEALPPSCSAYPRRSRSSLPPTRRTP